MSKEKQKIVPELRFPEFVGDGNWEMDIMGKRGTFNGGGTPSKNNKSFWKGNFPWISSSDILDNSIHNIDISRFITTDAIKKSATKVISENSLLIVSRVGVGKLAISRNKICTSQDFTNFTPNKDNLVFLGYLLKSKKGLLLSFSQGMAIKGFTKNDIFGLSLAFPKSIKEQKKIANCLSSLDNLITAETEKLAHLKDHKKGLLQQLFPANGESKPRYRFPEFLGDGDWEEKRVDDFFEVGSSKRVLQKDWVKEGVPFYRTRELVSLSKNEPFGSEIYISEELFLEISEKYGTPKADDFLVSGVGTLGILYQVKENDNFYFKDGNVIWFKLNSGIVSDYFKHCFHTKFFQKQIFRQSSASTVGTYTISNAKKTKFWKPIKKEEQQKISNCLSSIDDLIEAQKNKIETLAAHKKGLMQQLFPNIKDS